MYMKLEKNKNQINYYGTGRRKCAIARVYISSGTGNILINGEIAIQYLQYNSNYIKLITKPLQLLGLENTYDINIISKGGGLTGQASAIKLGIARALCVLDKNNRVILKSAGQLTRDSRVKERRKYGLKKARKAPQFSKR
uniref:ribosomal protein S9 n=1 Tax=Glaucosphaera vacuolata TaxID=38265 RepID=UPI001FCCECD0|nr:ribosomal protein S9 [Glaucosphaera vacuolata]UNJ18617.1 ribosomal protein S9 [Glaucosphaera vacuolata]